MTEFMNIEKYLLAPKYRKVGLILLIASPFLWIGVGTLLVVIASESGSPHSFDGMWTEWGLFLFHLPASIALYLMLLAKEKHEDEMYTRLRMEGILHGVRFIVAGMVAVTILGTILKYLFDQEFSLASIGGEMAVVTLLLFYSYASYYFLKKQFDEEPA